MGGEFILSHITDLEVIDLDGFAKKTKQVLASEFLYRVALSLQLTAPLCTIPLAFALYVTLKPVNAHLAQAAMLWRLGESFFGGIHTGLSFITLRLYTRSEYIGPFNISQLEALEYLTSNANWIVFNISTIFFSIGSILFFYLFYVSRYIPRVVAIFGVIASFLVTITGFANLVFPDYASIIQFGWAPMFIAEIATACWLIIAGINRRTLSKTPLLTTQT